MTIRYGIIGCGMMGVEHIHNIDLLSGTEIAAVFEPDPGMRGIVSNLKPEAFMAESLDALLNVDDLDCLLIASPNHLHVDQLEKIAAKRTLPILCEKPLYTDPSDLDRLKKLQSEYKAPIWVAMEYRYMPPIAKFLERAPAVTGGIEMLTITEHRFPFLQKVNHWNRFNVYSGGTLVEKCCHFFDLMRLTLKDDPVRVMASAGQAVNHLNEEYDGRRSDIWDNGYVIVEFSKGAKACLELSMFAEGSQYQEMIHAIGSSGKIECKVPGPGRFWNENLGPAPTPKLIESPRNPTGPKEIEIPVDPKLLAAGDHNGSTYYQHEKFLKVVRGEGEVEVSLDDGAWAVRLGLAAQKSVIEKRMIDV